LLREVSGFLFAPLICLRRRKRPALNILKTSIIIILLSIPAYSQTNKYTWLDSYDESNSIVNRIPVPDGFERTNADSNSFADWLRHLPLKEGKPPVYLYNLQEKNNQKAHFAVIDIDVGNKDLQQCADAVIRLRAEYLYSIKAYDAIHFKFTSGDNAEYRKWINGYRPIVNNNHVSWQLSDDIDSTYSNFKDYLETVFTYAGTHSLSRELQDVENSSDIQIGDVFINGGFPGHAVIVVDAAIANNSRMKYFLLAQSFMPAQDIHILNNPQDIDISPWYSIDFSDSLITPEWDFHISHLKRFKR